MTVSTRRRQTSEWGIEVIDLAAYLRRLRHVGPVEPSARTLRRLHRQHVTEISFENLDAPLRRGVRLDLTAVQDKLVRRRRGGYCHEQNLLFAAVLERLGFRVTRLLARVRNADRAILPRGHATLLAEAGAQTWLADVGFGADGPLEPIRFGATVTAHQGRWSYRLGHDGEWVLQTCRGGGDWIDLYSFAPADFRQPDFEMANHFVSTHPSSPFATEVIVARVTQHARYALRGDELTRTGPDGGGDRRRVSVDQLPRVLRNVFGIRLARAEARQLRSMYPPRQG